MALGPTLECMLRSHRSPLIFRPRVSRTRHSRTSHGLIQRLDEMEAIHERPWGSERGSWAQATRAGSTSR